MYASPLSRPALRIARRACGLVLVALAGGCAVLGGRGDGGRTETGWKMVMEKVPPAYLVAVDRSECTVSETRFAKIREGDNVLCAWRVGSIATDPRRGPTLGEPDRLPRPDAPPARLPRDARRGGDPAGSPGRLPGQP